jgi:rSAM/selenodomain-associated transferase 1
MHYPHGRLLLFAKPALPGRVKTRLARRYGKRGAAQLYRMMVRETLEKLQGLAPLELWCVPGGRDSFLRRCARAHQARLATQCGDDLGQRMHRAFAEALRSASWALIVGGDCVSLRRADVDLACASLEHGRDAVLGPAEDGGYVLLGLRRVEAGLFRAIPWGGPRVLATTRRRLAALGYHWAELPLRWDTDRPEDVRRWKLSRRSSRWCSGGS